MIILFGIFIYPLLQAFSQEGTLITYSYSETIVTNRNRSLVLSTPSAPTESPHCLPVA